MSDTENDIQVIHETEREQETQETQGEETQQKKGRKSGAVYKPARADDKRKETSRMNIEKARMVRNYKLNEQKKKKMEETLDKLNQVEIQDEDSDTEEEIFLTKAKTKNRKSKVAVEPAQQTYQNDRLDRIEGILSKLARKHKPQKEDRKTIIQLQQQAPAPVDDMTKQLKNKLLLKL